MRHRCAAVAALSLILFAAGPVATARSEPMPPEATSDPFPDIRYYDELNANDFAQPGGVWFIGPAGQNCGIWGRGSFGCSGVIPGAPAGTNHIGWIDGDRAVHYDWSMAVRFPAVEAGQPLPARSKIGHQGTTCAATPV